MFFDLRCPARLASAGVRTQRARAQLESTWAGRELAARGCVAGYGNANANRSPVSLCDKRGSEAAPVTMQRRHVHTQPFAFHAPQEDDESVKLSNIAHERSRALLPALIVARSAAAGIFRCFSVPSAFLRVLCVKSFDLLCPLHLQKPQLLIDTNEPLFRIPEFALPTKQITSKFLFDTNEIHPVTHYRLEITTKNGQNSRPRQPFSPRICVVDGAS